MKKKLVIFLLFLMAIASIIYIVKNKQSNNIEALTKSDIEALLNKYMASAIYMPCDTCIEANYEEAASIPNIMELRVVLNKIIGATKADLGETGWEQALPMVTINYDGKTDLNIIFIEENMIAINHDKEVYTVYELKDNAYIKTAIKNLYNSYKK
jgi:hypothetical protein